jgi:hypothetical protein
MDVTPEMVVHRVGGAGPTMLRLSALDERDSPPGISVLLGGTPQEAAAAMRQAFPKSQKWRLLAGTVGTATVAAVRSAGFDVLADATTKFPNHGRLIHPAGTSGFADDNLKVLSRAFSETTGC